MRPALVIASTATVALAIAGCSSGSSTPAASTTTAGAPATSAAAPATSAAAPATSAAAPTTGSGKGGYKITFIQGVKGDPFYATMQCGVEAAAKLSGSTVQTTGGNKWDATVQIPVVNSVTAQKPDAVLIAPNDVTALQAPLAALVANGSKLVLVDTGLTDNSKASSFVTSDNLAGGKLAADTLGALIGGKGTVFVQNVKAGISTTDARAKGFNDEMKAKFPNVKVLAVQYNDDDPAKAASITTSQLAAHPDLAGIFATNVQGAEGTATGLKQANKNGSVKVIGFDAGATQIADLQSGVVQALIAQEPYTIGYKGVQQAVNALTGKPTIPQIQTGMVAMTKANLATTGKWEYKTTC